jgi:hypothetical protein
VEGGGVGGLGANGNLINGGDGNGPGGGGGGARTGRYIVTTDPEWRRSGGTGGVGQIILSYVQIPAVEPPVLDYKRIGASLELSWSSSGFKAQVCTNLSSGTWLDVPDGAASPVNILPTQPSAFYRLTGQ